MLDATRIAAQLQKAGLWKEDAVNVTLRPLLPVAPKGKEASLRQRVASISSMRSSRRPPDAHARSKFNSADSAWPRWR